MDVACVAGCSLILLKCIGQWHSAAVFQDKDPMMSILMFPTMPGGLTKATAWELAFQGFVAWGLIDSISAVFKVATCGNNHDLQRSQWFIFQHLCFPQCTLQFLRPFQKNTGKKLACAIWPFNPLLWVSNSLSSIEWWKNMFPEVSSPKKWKPCESCFWSNLPTFIFHFETCLQPGNESPQKLNPFLHGWLWSTGPSSLCRRSIGFWVKSWGGTVLVPECPWCLGQLASWTKWITRSKQESLVHRNEDFLTESKVKTFVQRPRFGFPMPWD